MANGMIVPEIGRLKSGIAVAYEDLVDAWSPGLDSLIVHTLAFVAEMGMECGG